MGNTPAWYMTTQEFADHIVAILEQQDYFKKNDLVHPEDIVSAFTSTAESFAHGVGVAGRKMFDSQKLIQK